MFKRIKRLVMIAAVAVPAAAWAADEPPREIVFQVSTIGTLMEGGYDGVISAAGLKAQGDFGIGTFDALDGEMVLLKDTVYQARADGKVVRVKDNVTLPFAEATVFDADRTATVSGIGSLEQLEQALDKAFPDKNIPAAVQVRGEFSYIRTRSVPAQKKPYPRLVEVTKSQPVFERKNVSGTIVGFRFPASFQGMTVPGYHFHFISDDKKTGGHLLEVATGRANAVCDDTAEFRLVLPAGGPAPSAGVSAAEVRAAEK